MVIILKTKEKVLYNALNQKEDYVFMSINSINFDGKTYNANLTFYTKDEERELIFQEEWLKFSVQEADYLFDAFQIKGNTFSEQFINLVQEAGSHTLGVKNTLGLTKQDWQKI